MPLVFSSSCLSVQNWFGLMQKVEWTITHLNDKPCKQIAATEVKPGSERLLKQMHRQIPY